ncbi:MAG TPA: hypothetical protein VFB58_14450 [Chloroflexota bacterium]|nr:hypothetical protein [Chloroflexota bacterium]
MLKHSQVQNYLAALLERQVDVVPRHSVRPELRISLFKGRVRVL